jgi:hypothetical protein
MYHRPMTGLCCVQGTSLFIPVKSLPLQDGSRACILLLGCFSNTVSYYFLFVMLLLCNCKSAEAYESFGLCLSCCPCEIGSSAKW